jgi:hypothetical protein
MFTKLGIRVATEGVVSLRRYLGAESIKKLTRKTNKNGFIWLITFSSVLKYSLTVFELPSKSVCTVPIVLFKSSF